ncbi:serine hydrolase domain-containing protein [Promicromonospora thailandica]|uniref:CubicO group peptidase, beta-lactamase class C family n=1 Tax=Promicromonospora thailandica TaxID=765201 RepID=A0A9X2G6M7_9MICO|nr:serine hydrolase domain-containing protein [Promicromonospora thailandica]MCP2266615.1 CubicO group peptidase, beta-lactamase class C family [Promicromonospora thailandica]BFF17308.1 serine hydrolase domain-containing protein [Promicromonospora thailandica]
MTVDRTASILRSVAPYLAEWAAFQAAYHGQPGLQLAVGRRGEVFVDLAWGAANLETGEPLTSDHLFRVASHSKTFTGVLVMQLVERGALRLDDPVSTHVPELTGTPAAGVTLRELLGHQGGIVRDSSDGDFWQHHKPFLDRDEVLDVVRTEGVVFEPNEHFKYTNIGYSLLGIVIERVTGTTYGEAARTAVVEPLGLTRTGTELDPARSAEYAAGHTGRIAHDDARRVVPHVDTRAMAAATGWYSTALEMVRYGSAHVLGDTTLLTDASKRIMQREESRVVVRGQERGRYGVGLEVGAVGDRELVGHSGGYPGHITRTWIDPVDGLVVSALTNAVDGIATQIANGVITLVDLALAAADEVAKASGTAGPVEPVPADAPVGRFANLWGVADVVDLGGMLHVLNSRAAQPVEQATRLVVRDGALFHESVAGFGTVGEPVQVERADDGAVTAVRLGAMTSWPVEEYRRRAAG